MKARVDVRVHDPLAKGAPFDLHPLDEALDGADVLLLLTNHDEFMDIAPSHAAALMRGRTVYDTRNQFDRRAWAAEGFDVRVLGAGGV